MARNFGQEHADEAFFDDLSSLGLSQICDARARNQFELIFATTDVDSSVHHTWHLLKSNSYDHVTIEVSYVMNSCCNDTADEFE